jgi:phosphoribosylanthranilate isomerase
MRPAVKICGNKFCDEALLVASYEPDYMGWIFAPQSPRRISLERACRLLAVIRQKKPAIKHVAVFGGNSIAQIAMVRKGVAPDYMQVAGEPALILRATQLWKNCWPALQMQADTRYQLDAAGGKMLVLDAFKRGEWGGTGQRFNVELARNLERPFLAAGGLNAENVKEAIHAFSAIAPGFCGVDVASGIEDAPGKKNRKALARFMEHSRSG